MSRQDQLKLQRQAVRGVKQRCASKRHSRLARKAAQAYPVGHWKRTH